MTDVFFTVFIKSTVLFCDKCNILCHKSVTLKLFMTPHKNIVEALNCLALPDTPCIHGVKFPLCSYGVTEFLEKNKNSRF